MLRLNPGIDRILLYGLPQFFVGDTVQLRAGDGLGAVRDDAQLFCDGHGSVLVVAGNHDGPDARLPALGNGCLDLRANRVDHTGKTQENQIPLQIFGGVVLRSPVPVPPCGGQNPERPVGHGLVGGQNFLPLGLRHGQDPAVLLKEGAALENLVRRALGVLHEAFPTAVDGGHHLPGGIEGGLIHPGRFCLQLRLQKSLLGGKVYQSRLRRLPLRLTLGVQVGVGAKSHGGGQGFRLAQMLHHGHFVLGQGAGFVGADDLGAAQGLHRREPPNHRVAPGHIGDADGQHHGHHRSQALWNGGHRQRHGHHEGGKHAVQGEGTGHHQVKHEDEHADAQHQLGKGLAQLIQTALQGGLLLLGLGQDAGDFAHFRIHAGIGDEGLAPSVDHGGAHIAQILPVSQRYLLLTGGQTQSLHHLVDGDAFAGEGGLLDFQAGAFQQTAVGGDAVAGLQDHHVAGNQLIAVKGSLFSVPQHLTGGGGHGLERFNGGLGLALLHHPQHRVQQHHDQDDEHLRQTLLGHEAGDGGHTGCNQQDNQHGVLQLGQEPLQKGGLFPVLQLVGAEFFKTLPGLLGGKTFRAGIQGVQHFVGRLGVGFFHGSCSFRGLGVAGRAFYNKKCLSDHVSKCTHCRGGS